METILCRSVDTGIVDKGTRPGSCVADTAMHLAMEVEAASHH
jgi:hypothetical protein